MGRIIKCRSFADVYELIGENRFQKGAAWLLLYMCLEPVIAGIINFIMLLDIPSYDAYVYNSRWLLVSNIGFFATSLFFVIYITGKIQYNKWYIEEAIGILKQREPWLVFWIVLLIWGIFPSLAAGNITGALLGATELSAGYISHVNMMCVLGCAALLDNKGRDMVLKAFVLVADFCALVMIAFEHEITILWWFSGYSGVSVFTNSNHYGYYLAMAIPCITGLFYMSFEKIQKSGDKKIGWCVVYLFSLAIHMQALVINDCMGAFLGVFFSLIFMLIFWKVRFGKLGLIYFLPMFFLITMVVLSYLGFITSKLGTTTGTSLIILFQDIFKVAGRKAGYEKAGTNRIRLWKEAVRAISQKPILGYGPDNLYDRWNQPCVSMTPHNEFLECALYMGIPGLFLYLGGLICLLVGRIKLLKKLPEYMLMAAGAVFSYQISAFFGVRKYHTVSYMFMFLGMLVLKDNEEKNEKDEN